MPSPPLSALPATVLTRTSSSQNEVRGSNGCCVGHTYQADGVISDGDQGIRTDIGDVDATGKVRRRDVECGNIEPILTAADGIGIETDNLIVSETCAEHEGVIANATREYVV